MKKRKTDQKRSRGIVAGLWCIAMLLFLTACSQRQQNFTRSGPHKVILDTDTAADDAMALIMAAKASNIELKGVTVLAGNVSLEQGCKNALMSLEVAGRKDVPVYPGSDTSYSGKKIEPFSVFGTDGMGDQGLIHPTGTPVEKNGVDFILETVSAEPGEIEIVAVGPLTNVAKAIEKDPETMQKVKRIWSMGTGGTTHFGNATPVAEFNVYMDIEAYECVLDSGIPMTVLGNDVCDLEGIRVGRAEIEKLSKAGECGAFLSQALALYVNQYAEKDGYTQVCDPVAMAAVIWTDFVEEAKICDAEAVTEDGAAKGQVVFYPQGSIYDAVDMDALDYHIEVITDLNGEAYYANVARLIR